MGHSTWRSLIIALLTLALAYAYDECLLGFGLQGLNPFESTDWDGRYPCDKTLAAADVLTNWCSTTWTYSCFWSVVECTADDDASCSCQACGGMPPNLDEYMAGLELWDRARCAVYALEQEGYDVTPCVEAIVDSMSMPGVTEAWTAPAVDPIECVAIVYGSYYNDAACAYSGTARLAAEAFESSDGPAATPTITTPAPKTGDASATTSPVVTVTPAPFFVSDAPVPTEDDDAGELVGVCLR